MTRLTSTATFVPGAPSGNSGPSHPPSHLDHLPTPWGTVGKTETAVLRSFFHKLGIPESHTAGRLTLCEKYRQILTKVGNEASDKAVTKFLDKYKD
jgi:hypothetical protein